jgi:DNA (cytosine-5)-methyltransferase 1
MSAGGFKAVSLFSGAGGMDIGIRQAGFEILAQIESDRHCCETLRAAALREGNASLVIESDIRDVAPADLSERLNIDDNGLDLLFGGPPCQPFSIAGKQNGLDDSRGPLLFEIIRFARHFRPKVILLEQVKGLLSAKDPEGARAGVFRRFMEGLSEAGYSAKWRICCAADYGVPQLRERLFVFASRVPEGRFEFPGATHAASRNLLCDLPPYRTVGEAISGLGEPGSKETGKGEHARTDSHIDVTPDRDRERISDVPEGSYLACQTHLSPDVRRGLSRKDTTKYRRLDRNKPSNTLRCGEIFYHPVENRYLTPRECMRLHGYGDDYLLLGPIRSRTGVVKNLDQHRQVANSVPPPLARTLGEGVVRYLNA